MTRRKLALAGAAASLALAAPLHAQQADPHAGHTQPAPAPSPAPAPADAHAGHAMEQAQSSTPAPAPAADPHAGHTMEPAPTAAQADPHAGHVMPAAPEQADEAVPAAEGPVGTDQPAGDAPPPPLPTDHAADAVYGADAMQMGRHHLAQFHGGQKLYQVMLNTAEAQFRDGRDGYEWDLAAWYGGDLDRLWLKSEGEGAFGGPLESAEMQALYSRAIGPYFNLQAGVRYDVKPDPSRVYAAVGFEGLAPSFFDVEGALFLSNKGELMARLEGSYDQRITQRLILQPSVEINFAAQDTPELGIGAGLSDAEVGLRLRYDIRREFAPYIGVQYRRAFGETRRFLRADGEDVGGWSLLTGIRAWF